MHAASWTIPPDRAARYAARLSFQLAVDSREQIRSNWTLALGLEAWRCSFVGAAGPGQSTADGAGAVAGAGTLA